MSVEVIAEIGVNHNNNRDTAIMMIGAAMGAGANVVKFQASTVREEVSLRAAPEHYAFGENVLRSAIPAVGPRVVVPLANQAIRHDSNIWKADCDESKGTEDGFGSGPLALHEYARR